MLYMGVYVDDIVLAGKTDTLMKKVKSALSEKFKIKDIHYFLGIPVVQDEECKSAWIGQPAYAENLLTKYGYAGLQAM